MNSFSLSWPERSCNYFVHEPTGRPLKREFLLWSCPCSTFSIGNTPNWQQRKYHGSKRVRRPLHQGRQDIYIYGAPGSCTVRGSNAIGA